MAKSWFEKLDTKKEHKIIVLEHSFGGIPKGETMLVATPRIVADKIKRIPKGQHMTRIELRKTLAKEYKAFEACPLSTAIFIRIVAEAMYEQFKQGVAINDLVPFWRVVDIKAEKKYSFPHDFLEQQRKEENIAI